MELTQKKESTYMWVIGALSVVIPLAVAVLLFAPWKLNLDAAWLYFLPALNAMINSATAVVLIAGLIAVKKNNVNWHRTFMTTAFVLGSLFLVSYVIYHSSAPSVKFGDVNLDGVVSDVEKAQVGYLRTVYLGVLLSHIVLAAIVVPLVLLAVFYAITNKIDKHRKIVKFTFPIWLYVSVTGVLVYLMIAPYYPN